MPRKMEVLNWYADRVVKGLWVYWLEMLSTLLASLANFFIDYMEGEDGIEIGKAHRPQLTEMLVILDSMAIGLILLILQPRRYSEHNTLRLLRISYIFFNIIVSPPTDTPNPHGYILIAHVTVLAYSYCVGEGVEGKRVAKLVKRMQKKKRARAQEVKQVDGGELAADVAGEAAPAAPELDVDKMNGLEEFEVIV